MSMYTYIHIYIYMYMYNIYIYTYMSNVCMYVCVYIYIYIYIYAYLESLKLQVRLAAQSSRVLPGCGRGQGAVRSVFIISNWYYVFTSYAVLVVYIPVEY